MKKEYIAPLTERTEVELEQGFMTASVFEEQKNTENLSIDNQRVSDDVFDFSKENEWKQ